MLPPASALGRHGVSRVSAQGLDVILRPPGRLPEIQEFFAITGTAQCEDDLLQEFPSWNP
jgi:hypothetical protein